MFAIELHVMPPVWKIKSTELTLDVSWVLELEVGIAFTWSQASVVAAPIQRSQGPLWHRFAILDEVLSACLYLTPDPPLD